jgi:hypothetical protein
MATPRKPAKIQRRKPGRASTASAEGSAMPTLHGVEGAGEEIAKWLALENSEQFASNLANPLAISLAIAGDGARNPLAREQPAIRG